MEREPLLDGKNGQTVRSYKLNIDSSLFTKLKSSISTSSHASKSPNTSSSGKLASVQLSSRKLKKRVRAEITQRPIPVIETVFVSPQPQRPIKLASPPRTLDHLPPPTHQEFVAIVDSLKRSISNPTKPLLPKLNQSGSSGSYFCRDYLTPSSSQPHDQEAPPSERVEIVGIFKPKDEEPYGAMNPKWTKWAHRVFLAPLVGGFGRGCLIPNLSYLSEAAASLLDRRLQTFIVPRTEVVSISSPTFFYSWLDLRKPELPSKPGSFQLFCHGFEDASIFLKKHPWPGFPMREDHSQNIRKKPRRFSLFRLLCGHRRNLDVDSDDDDDPGALEHSRDAPPPPPALGPRTTSARDQHKDWVWTVELMEDFRIEMEKLVIVDYLMRNTDRGLDNFMIKVCNATSCTSGRSRERSNPSPSTSSTARDEGDTDPDPRDYRRVPHCHVAAIDNSLAFPHQHPNGWREYAYGWLFLPASLIGQPFSRSTREYFLPLLTSQQWWAETVYELRKLFGIDPDFNVRMFERQMAVMKGQAWNIVECLKHEEEGPLELCRRQKALVWDEAVQVIWDEVDQAIDMEGAREEDEESDELGKLRSTSAPATHSYFPASPMKVVAANNKRPVVHRGWSSRTSSSHNKIPPRPVGSACHHLTLDGARGLDLMKQMDALEAWHNENDIEVASFRSDQRVTQHRNGRQALAYFQAPSPKRFSPKQATFAQHGGYEERGDGEAGDGDTGNDPLPAGRRISKSSHQTKLEQRMARNKLGLISIRSHSRLGHQNRKKKAHMNGIDAQQAEPEAEADQGRDVDDDDVDGEEEDDDEDDGDENGHDDEDEVDDGQLITIGVVEKLEFVVAQPFFKNC